MSSSSLAHVWSLKGNIRASHLEGNLEGSLADLYFLQANYESLKAFSSAHPSLQELFSESIEALSVFNQPLEGQEKSIVEMARSKKMWIKPLMVGDSKSNHQLEIVGTPQIIALCNKAAQRVIGSGGEIRIPSGIHFFTVPSGFDPACIISLRNGSFSQAWWVMKAFMSLGLEPLGHHTLSAQKVGNCVAAAKKAAVLATLMLAHMRKGEDGLSKEAIVKAFAAVKPPYKGWSVFHRERALSQLKASAEIAVVAAAESKALIKFIRLQLRSAEFRDVLPLLKSDYQFIGFESKKFGELSLAQQGFYSDIAKTSERHDFLRHLLSLNRTALNERIANYIQECHITTFIYDPSII